MHRRSCRLAVIALIMVDLLPSFSRHADVARGDTVYSQLPGTSPHFISETDIFQVADDFTLPSTATITDIRWWGTYYTGDPSVPTPPPTSTTFGIRFYADLAGSPALAPFYSEDGVNVTPVSGFPNPSLFSATLGTPLMLAGGTTYYLSLIDQTADLTWGWTRSGSGALTGNHFYRFGESGSWSNDSGNTAFELLALPQAVPLPPAALPGLSLLAGIGALGIIRKRRVAH